MSDSILAEPDRIVDDVSALLDVHHSTLEDTAILLMNELRKARADGDYYRKKLATALNENQNMENRILEMKQELRGKDQEIQQKEAMLNELRNENDALQMQLKRQDEHAGELKALINVAFDDSGRSRRLLQEHLHHGCGSDPKTIAKDLHEGGDGTKTGETGGGFDYSKAGDVSFALGPTPSRGLPGSPDPTPSGIESSHTRGGSATVGARGGGGAGQGLQRSFLSAAIEEMHARPVPMSSSAAGVPMLPKSPIPDLPATHRAPSHGVPHSSVLNTSHQQRSTMRIQSPSGAVGSAVATGNSSATSSAGVSPVQPPLPGSVSAPPPIPVPVPADKGKSMGIVTSTKEMLTVASVDHAVVCYTSISGDDLHFAAKIRSSKLSEVALGIESASSGSMCTLGFRNEGYVLAVTRASWSEQRDIWRGVLTNPIPALSINPADLHLEVAWSKERRTLDIFVNGENVTKSSLFLVHSSEQPAPYYPVVMLPCAGDEIQLLATTMGISTTH